MPSAHRKSRVDAADGGDATAAAAERTDGQTVGRAGGRKDGRTGGKTDRIQNMNIPQVYKM